MIENIPGDSVYDFLLGDYESSVCIPLKLEGDYSFIENPIWLGEEIKKGISNVHPSCLEGVLIEANDKFLEMEVYVDGKCKNKNKLAYLSLFGVFLYKVYTNSGKE